MPGYSGKITAAYHHQMGGDGTTAPWTATVFALEGVDDHRFYGEDHWLIPLTTAQREDTTVEIVSAAAPSCPDGCTGNEECWGTCEGETPTAFLMRADTIVYVG
jgi:hypothetical protein